MNYVIINLSPREKGTSTMFTKYFENRIKSDINFVETVSLYKYIKNIDIVINKIKEADSIIMIGPCYVTSYPADTINLLDKMSSEEGILHGQSLYGFIQGGMPYVHTHEHGIKLLESFAQKENVNFKGGFVMGGGAALNGQPLEKILGAKKIVPAVNTFIEHIKNDEEASKNLYKDAEMKIPYLITKMILIMMNKNIKKDLNKRGIDYNQKSPYAQ